MSLPVEIREVGLFGVTTGQDCWPLSLTDFVRPYYLENASQPREVLFVERTILGWMFSYVNYRFNGSGGRSNSHMGVTAIYNEFAPHAPKEIWQIFSDFFDFLEQSGKLFQRMAAAAHDGGPMFQFCVGSFDKVPNDWLRAVLDQLRQHVVQINGTCWLVGTPATSNTPRAVAYFDLDEEIGVSLDSLLRGERVGFVRSLGKKEIQAKALAESLERKSKTLTESEQRVRELETQLSAASRELEAARIERGNFDERQKKLEGAIAERDSEIAKSKSKSGKWPDTSPSPDRAPPPYSGQSLYQQQPLQIERSPLPRESGKHKEPASRHAASTKSFDSKSIALILGAIGVVLLLVYFMSDTRRGIGDQPANPTPRAPTVFDASREPAASTPPAAAVAGTKASDPARGEMVITAPMFIVIAPPRAESTRRRLALSPGFLKLVMSQPVGKREEIIVASAYRLRQTNPLAFDACVGTSIAGFMTTVRTVNPDNSKLLLNPSPNTAVGALIVRGLSPDDEKACEELK